MTVCGTARQQAIAKVEALALRIVADRLAAEQDKDCSEMMEATRESARRYLPRSDKCFVCGDKNHAGLQGRFYIEDDTVKMRLLPQAYHCGYDNVVHGGVVAAALDECMGWAATLACERMCVTGELTVRYLKRTPDDRPLTVCASLARYTKRVVDAESILVDEAGEVYARAKGRFVPLSVEETLLVDDNLVYNDDDLHVFSKLRAGKGDK